MDANSKGNQTLSGGSSTEKEGFIEKGERKARPMCKIDSVGWLSFISFSWMFGFMWRSFRQKDPPAVVLTESDGQWTCSVFDSANVNMTRLEHLWNDELKSRPEDPNLFRVVFRFMRGRLLLTCLIFLFCIIFGFIGPTCIVRGLISFVERPPYRNGGIDFSSGWILAAGMLIVEILRVLAYGATWAISYRTGIRIRGAVLALLYKHLLSARSLRGKTSAEVVNIYANDGQRIFDAVTFAPLVLVGPFVLIGGLIYLLQVIGPWSLIAIGVFLLFDVMQAILGIIMVKCRNSAITETENRMSLLGEIIGCIRTIKLNAWEDLFFDRVIEFRRKETKYLRIAGYAQSLAVASGSIVPVVATIVMVMAIVLSGSDIAASDAFSAITVFFVMLFGIRMIPYGIRYLAEARQALLKVQELLLLPKHDTSSYGPIPSDTAIQIRNGTFTWDTAPNPESTEEKMKVKVWKEKATTEEETALNGTTTPPNGNAVDEETKENSECFRLRDLNLGVRKGELVGVCGIVGCGKTAFLNAITGHLVDERGTLDVSGTIAICPQTPCILNDTIRENILFGQPLISQRYYKAISCAQLNQDLERMPSNEQSMVTAAQLSGGQRSRLSIARALYSNRDIFLFDDIFSSIDKAVADKIFQSAIKEMLASKTVIIVTSNPQYLKECDRVIFLDKGTLMGVGPHAKLLSTSEPYKELFNSLEASSDHQREEEPPAIPRSPVKKKGLGLVNGHSNSTSKIESVEEIDESKEEDFGSRAVDKHVYFEYISAGGGYLVFAIMLIAFTLNVGCNIFSTFWLSKWMKDVHGRTTQITVVSSQSSHRNVTKVQGSLADSQDFNFYASIYSLSLCVLLVSGLLKAFVFVRITLGAATRLHNRMLKMVLFAVCRFFHITPTGRILNRFSKDMDEVDVKLPFSVEAFLQCIITCIGFLLMIIWVFPAFLLASLPLLCAFLIFFLCFRAGIRLLKRQENVSRSPLFDHLNTSLESLPTIHAYAQTNRFLEHLKMRLDENSGALFLYNAALRWQAVWLDLLVVTVTFVVSVLTVLLTGSVTPSDAGMAIAFALQMSGIFQFGVRSLTELETKMTSVERILYYCKNIQTEPGIPDPMDLPDDWPAKGDIRFENVVLRYEPNSPPALQNVNLEIENGQRIGIIGRTGGGKSSLCNTLFRLYPLESGRILLDSRDISTVNLRHLRRSMAMIPQDPTLFSGTLRFNLDPEAKCEDDQIWECLRRIDLDEAANFFVKQNLEFQVESGGQNLSSGQRQLVCMVRALLRNVKVVVLDEATANVDMQTDVQLQSAVRSFFSDRTVILITHRLNNVVDMDRIYLVEEGRLRVKSNGQDQNSEAKDSSLNSTQLDQSSIAIQGNLDQQNHSSSTALHCQSPLDTGPPFSTSSSEELVTQQSVDIDHAVDQQQGQKG